MNVFLHTLGCRLNEAEIEGWARQFRARGHRVVAAPRSAHIIVLNTCAVTREAARKSRKLTSQLHRQNPEARLVLTGCFAELEPASARSLAGVDAIVQNSDKDELVSRVEREIESAAMPALASEPDSAHVYRESRTRAFVKAQDGCRNRCTFCVVTIARGSERSRPISELVDEVRGLAEAGYREVVLTGVHLGGYGRDLGADLPALVRALCADTDIPRLRLSSLEPWDLPSDFGALFSHPRLMPHLHLPLQSGSDGVLKRMARRCSTESYRALLSTLRADIPDLAVTTDVIAGFPGETDDEWADTLSFVKEMRFAHIHIFGYSRREGTTAARMPGQLPSEVVRARARELRAVASAQKEAHLRRLLGQTRQVLWETPGDPAEDGAARWIGYTDHYARVEARAPTDWSLENQITPATLRGLAGDPPDRIYADISTGFTEDQLN